ncbi:MAG: DNA primase [Sphingobium sp.]|nr:DNA primase [Sphingobium sp.]
MRERIDRALSGADLLSIVGAAINLGKGNNRQRGRCPFHGSKSDSFAIYPEKGYARCWGCGWHGDAIKFLMDHEQISFAEALSTIEGGAVSGGKANPVTRTKSAYRRRADVPMVDSVILGRWLWKHSVFDPDAIRTYLRGRGVPDHIADNRRLTDIRFCGLGPISVWRADRGPDSVKQAPAMLALVRGRPIDGFCMGPGPKDDVDDWPAIGVHATFLAPDLRDKMRRVAGDGTKLPSRKMLGPVGRGCVWLPGESFGLGPKARLFGGEGIETVLSGIAMMGGGAESWGMAMLSLVNLQGAEPRIRGGAIPLYDPRPSGDRPALCFTHQGPVVGLMDADMKPLRGQIDPKTGAHLGEKLIEKKGGPIVRRALSSAERTQMCATLFTRAWRAAGCPDVRAVRPRMGLDFNDAIKEAGR